MFIYTSYVETVTNREKVARKVKINRYLKDSEFFKRLKIVDLLLSLTKIPISMLN